MDDVRTLKYIPPNLQEAALYQTVSENLDRAINHSISTNGIDSISYTENMSYLESVWDPSSDFYEAERVLARFGAKSLNDLMSDLVDKTTLSMIITGLYEIKGTQKGLETVLKLLKIEYQAIVYLKLDNGCTDAIIILNQYQRIEVSDLILIDKFAAQVFPLCLQLAGITNCYAYTSGAIYAGYNTINLGQHRLDRDFHLDLSRLSRSYGIIDPTLSNTIAILLCNLSTADLTVVTDIPIDTLMTHGTLADMQYLAGSQGILDRNLYLDRFNQDLYYKFLTMLSHSTMHELDWTVGQEIDLRHYRYSYNAFILDHSELTTAVNQPLDGLQSFILYENTLDRNFFLSGERSIVPPHTSQRFGVLDRGTGIRIDYTGAISIRAYDGEFTWPDSTYDTDIRSLLDSYRFNEISNSQYLGMVNI